MRRKGDLYYDFILPLYYRLSPLKKLVTNFQSKVVGVSIKDRASILPDGHNPTAAFWIDDASGKLIASSYYISTLPTWVDNFNDSKPIDKLLANGWNTLLSIEQYTESTTDHSALRQMPFGNSLTLQFARAAIDGIKSAVVLALIP